MQSRSVLEKPHFRAYGRRHLDRLPEIERLSIEQRVALKAVSAVLPFRVNEYIIRELIDWDDIPNDPIFQLTFPQAGMLDRADLLRLEDMVVTGEEGEPLERLVNGIRLRMNPNPAGQKLLNVPRIDGERVLGCQHKYRETVLFFPLQARPATPTAPTASDGRSSSASRICGLPPATRMRSCATSPSTAR